MMGVNATGWKSFRAIALKFFGTSAMVAVLKLVGTTAWSRDRLTG